MVQGRSGQRKGPAPSGFGREVRRRRSALGITLEQLAERSGLSPNYIGTVETGVRDPSLTTVFALAKGLGVAPGELVGGVGELSPAAVEAASLIDSMPADVRHVLVALLRTLTKRRRRDSER